MHDIEPFFRWREQYASEDDDRSPFFERQYNEPKQIYNYLIHPYWDDFGSETLYLKVLFADYDEGFAVIEMIGEWNDAVGNDVMFLKRNAVEPFIDEGISRFILIAENVLNFHGSDDCYYEEWAEECRDAFNGGWIAILNTYDHVAQEMEDMQLDAYVHFGIAFNGINWRGQTPQTLLRLVESRMRGGQRRLN